MKKQTTVFAVMSTAVLMSLAPVSAGPSASMKAYAASSGWVVEDGSPVCYDEDGYLVTDSWRKNGNDWYYLGEDGRITRNTKVDEYYLDSDGKMVRNAWVELINEEDMDSPETPASYWYFFDGEGRSVVSSWKKVNGKWYYFDDSGHMLTGKNVINDETYYLGKETDGSMHTGWVRLEENASTPDGTEGWYYFNSDGKMVTTQYDKRIDGAYYTFIDGRMQTGWVLMPKDEAETAADATDTEDGNNTKAKQSVPGIADYRFYGLEGDGKRAEGWRTVEGIEGIHDPDETYTFYFRNGKPLFSPKKGNELFSINAKKYAFNELGVMQTGQKIVNLENGEIANCYFGEDGVMKTGKQTIYNEDTGENENWFFYTDGDRKGQGYHGLKDNVLYVYGRRQEATADQRYAPASYNGTTYLVNTTGAVQRASSTSASSSRPELGRGYRDFKDANGTIWVVDVNGVIQ